MAKRKDITLVAEQLFNLSPNEGAFVRRMKHRFPHMGVPKMKSMYSEFTKGLDDEAKAIRRQYQGRCSRARK